MPGHRQFYRKKQEKRNACSLQFLPPEISLHSLQEQGTGRLKGYLRWQKKRACKAKHTLTST